MKAKERPSFADFLARGAYRLGHHFRHRAGHNSHAWPPGPLAHCHLSRAIAHRPVSDCRVSRWFWRLGLPQRLLSLILLALSYRVWHIALPPL